MVSDEMLCIYDFNRIPAESRNLGVDSQKQKWGSGAVRQGEKVT